MSGWRKRTIMEMAREADTKANLSEPYFINPETIAWLERLAKLVRADEREACEALCKWRTGVQQVDAAIDTCAAAIRARGQA